jgi:hypothetical protein
VGNVKTRKRVNAQAGESIRTVFLSPQEFYAPAEGALLLGWTADEMKRAIANGDIAVERDGAHDRVAWREIAEILTAQLPQAAIEEALGPAMTSVIPEPVRLAELRIRIPRYQVEMLTKLAERERVSVDELMARHLLDLAGAEVHWLRRRTRGFEAAMRWPG